MARPIPYLFILEELAPLHPYTKPMFGFIGVYVDTRIVFILKQHEEKFPEDNGLWIATTGEHHASLKKELPSMRSLAQFGPGPTGWQTIPEGALSFEEEALRAVAMVKKGDPRIGKEPKRRKPSKKKLVVVKKKPAKKPKPKSLTTTAITVWKSTV